MAPKQLTKPDTPWIHFLLPQVYQAPPPVKKTHTGTVADPGGGG